MNFKTSLKKLKKEYKKKSLNKIIKVLFENKINDHQFFGRDEFQNSIIVNCKDNIEGKIMSVKIKDFNLNTLVGDLVDSKNLAA